MPIQSRVAFVFSPSIHRQWLLTTRNRVLQRQHPRCCTITTSTREDRRERILSPANSRLQTKWLYRIAATWLVPNPAKVLPEQIIRRLPRLDPVLPRPLSNAVFLVTPSFASWLDDDGVFLEPALCHMYGSFPAHFGEQMHPVHSSVAVVDRLPSQMLRAADVRSKAPVSSIDGHEGIALWIGAARNSPDSVRPLNREDAGQHLVRMTFARRWKQPKSATTIELRPSNTLFINGNQSTMFQDSWAMTQVKVPKLKRIGSRKTLKTIDFHIPSDAPAFNAPIEALTEPREIVSSMGNVMRQLKSPKDGKTIPASTELEVKVPQYLARRSGTSGTLLVFALVTPAGLSQTRESDGLIQPSEGKITGADASSLRRALLAGAHFHRVTSGGGGWGQKQGLLSLDPAFDFAKHDDTGSLDAMLEEGRSMADATSMNAVNPGDSVQFFASYEPEQQALPDPGPGPLSTRDIDTSGWSESRWTDPTQLHTIVGSLPAQDDMPTPSSDDTGPHGRIIGIPDQFGMLSAGGTCLRRYIYRAEPSGADPNHSIDKAKDGGTGKMTQVSVSRMDIPYGYWKVQAGNYPLKHVVKRLSLAPERP